MIKYYKTPDVIFTDNEGSAFCHNGVIVLDTSKMSDESNAAALRLVNALHFIKCFKTEAEDHEVCTPCGVVEYKVSRIVDCPKSVYETRLGVFIINGDITIDTNCDGALLGQLLYGD